MPRPLKIAVVVAGLLLFLAVSVAVTRVVAVGSSERGAVAELAEAQTTGDVAAVARLLDDCDPGSACRRHLERLVPRMKRTGKFEVLNIDSGLDGTSVGDQQGAIRIAWRTGPTLATVQCVTVRRKGGVVRGFSIHLLSLSNPIGREADCDTATGASTRAGS